MDLRYYNTTINPVGLVSPAREKYVRDVHEHLKWVHRTTSGRILLNSIRRPNFPIEIRPHPTAVCNAVGGSERKPGAASLTGVITYTPFTFSSHGSCAVDHAMEKAGRLWDEILFHELVHVFRAATGSWNQAPQLTFGMRQYDDNEEFIAVLCTNIYVSDRTNKIKSGLRAGHQGFGAMTPQDARRFGLFTSSKAAFGLVKQFCADNPIFTKALSDKLADVEYNPIADFYRYPKLCELLSTIGGLTDKAKMIDALVAVGIPRPVAAQFVMLAP
ncbi:hypothetical protein [Phreatobacter stygius]|uniref:Uncharacterized protein n=1 Tax=Phreatobacter stygius TaxID=1940610 RepID=A0A4D7BIJ4_9HYPH|nr:hypothetical protein [Phreatobacter stygius]QCI67607.1 hypothetical protein E8M01_27295 [Phreatobacter stygius]